MPRVYTVSYNFDEFAVTTAKSLLQLQYVDANKPIELYGFNFYVTNRVQEAAEEWIRCRIIDGYTSAGSGTTLTPQSVSPIDTAAGFSALANSISEPGGGTPLLVDEFSFNVRKGWSLFLPAGSGYFLRKDVATIALYTAPSVSMNFGFTVWICEYP